MKWVLLAASGCLHLLVMFIMKMTEQAEYGMLLIFFQILSCWLRHSLEEKCLIK